VSTIGLRTKGKSKKASQRLDKLQTRKSPKPGAYKKKKGERGEVENLC